MNGILEVKPKLAKLLQEAVSKAQSEGKIPDVSLPEITLERPQKAEHGDYASSLPLKMARSTGVKPIELAGIITSCLPEVAEVEKVEVAPPGFINITLNSNWLRSQVETVLKNKDSYGSVNIGQGKKVQVEFVSVNPTGPIHVGHGRGAILGSSLASILQNAGYDVQKEFYVNDAGNQIASFKRSLYARYMQALGKDIEMPSDGYFGDYMRTLAAEVKEAEGDKYSKLSEEEALKELGKLGLEKMLAIIRADLEALGVNFDCWFSEQSLYDNGQYDNVMKLLEENGHIVQKEGATWFSSTNLGEDKDNVVVRSDGTATYFATDMAYHYNKFKERGFEKVINIWGADHQGHVSRMKAVLSALGINPDSLEVIIAQMVTLKRGKELVRISKRGGDLITLKEVIDEVGADACRFFFLSRSADSQMDFDLELAKKESSENPVYYIQYAHARIASILELAEENGLNATDGDISLLSDEAELALIRKMLLLPEIIETAALKFEPHHVSYYALDLATAFHSFYKQCRVVDTANAELSKARIKLVSAAKVSLKRTLGIMQMSAPDKM